MNTRRYLIGLIFLVLAGQTPAATKSDTAKEKRWEEQIVPSLMVGEAVKLKAAGVEFLSLYAPNTDKKTFGGVILIHGIGAHPVTANAHPGQRGQCAGLPAIDAGSTRADPGRGRLPQKQGCEKHRDHRAQHGHDHGEHLPGKQTGPGGARLHRHRHEQSTAKAIR